MKLLLITCLASLAFSLSAPESAMVWTRCGDAGCDIIVSCPECYRIDIDPFDCKQRCIIESRHARSYPLDGAVHELQPGDQCVLVQARSEQYVYCFVVAVKAGNTAAVESRWVYVIRKS